MVSISFCFENKKVRKKKDSKLLKYFVYFTLSVDLFGGAVFVLNKTLAISSKGKLSSGFNTNNVESHRFFDSGVSNLMFNASILNHIFISARNLLQL
jgi:hypothetical protein